MKILFVLRHSLYLRNYESTVRRWASEGHDVTLAFTPLRKTIQTTLLDELLADHSNISETWLPTRSGRWRLISDGFRRLRDYLRYLAPKYENAEKLRERAGSPLPGFVKAPFRVPFLGYPVFSRVASVVLAAVERCIPIDEATVEFVRNVRPDVFIVTPLVDMSYSQLDYLKAARSLGIPSALMVASWDNLTNKGLIQVRPDKVVVWNDIQKREAIEMHGVAADSVIVTGAQLFDHWFVAKPATTYAEYSNRVGLRVDRPMFLYVCSSIFIAREEVDFVREWIAAIRRSSDDVVQEAGILIRPHPANVQQWSKVDFSEFSNVEIWPRSGAVPVDTQSKNDYFDSLFHASAVVGINTSAFIEAGILGKPVLTVHDPRFTGTQAGTLHYHYLVEEGLLEVAADLSENVDMLARITAGETWYLDSNTRFLKRFVRPHGLDKEATPLVAAAVTDLGGQPARDVERTPFWAPLVLCLLFPLTGIAEKLRRKRANKGRKGRGGSGFVLRLAFDLSARLISLLGLKKAVRRHVLPKIVAAMGASNQPLQLVQADNVDAQAKKQLKELAASDKKILVGPWLSEVGFEVLYWIPFLSWAIQEFGIDKKRLVVLSRGGTGDWYRDVAQGGYVDAFEFFTPENFQVRTEERWQEAGGQKQMHLSDFDQEFLRRSRAKLGLKEADSDILHPALMYSFYRAYWRGGISVKILMKRIAFQYFPPVSEHAVLKSLPDQYVAVRFYFRPSLPDTSENRAFIARVLVTLARRMPVVMLNPGFRLDDHEDFGDDVADRIIFINDHMTPETNLAVQTAVIAKSRLFVGTYGGLSYLAPFYNVPSLAFYSHGQHFLPSHLIAANAAYQALGRDSPKERKGKSGKDGVRDTATFSVLSTTELKLILRLLAPPGASESAEKLGEESPATPAYGQVRVF